MKASFILPALAAVATATELESKLDARAVLTSAELAKLDLYAQYAGSSYCNTGKSVGSLITCSNSACPTVATNKATVYKTFAGSSTDIRGLIALDHTSKSIVVSFRGSQSIRNWITNLLFAQVSCSSLVSGCLVHAGFYAAWNEISSSVLSGVRAAKTAYPGYQVISTGHSLGGALATIAAGFIRKAGYPTNLYSYGAPRVGNNAFSAFVTNQAGLEYRVTHDKDPVPKLPPIIFNYRHTSPEYWASTADPSVSQYKLCTGYASISCNAGTLGLEFNDHAGYMGSIAACSPGGMPWKRDDMTDAELEAQLTMWAKEDITFVTQNPAAI